LEFYEVIDYGIYDICVMWKNADFKISKYVKRNNIEDNIIKHKTLGKVIRMIE